MSDLLIFAIIGVAMIVIITAVFIGKVISDKKVSRQYEHPYERPEERAGREGEYIATNIIREALRSEDILLTNVDISYDGREAELDNVIINKYGVFIIEVKNYAGTIYGNADDHTWIKCKTDPYGNSFTKSVRNPIKQVNRQVYLLAKYLRECGFNVWVEGYAFFVQGNSPVICKEVLSSLNGIDKALHTFGRNRLSVSDTESIRDILSSCQSARRH